MKLSPYFHQLLGAYQAELDDLAQDSDGQNVLAKRLQQKRKEMPFLVQMMSFSPEMVAVVFHQAFEFKQMGAMEKLVSQPEGSIPSWINIQAAVTMQPWAQPLAAVVLKDPQGASFLALAAGLEFALLHQRAQPTPHADHADDSQEGDDDYEEQDDDFNPLDADDARDPSSPRQRAEAEANWLSDVGFDRKDGST